MSCRSDTILKTVFQILRGDAVWVVGRWSEGDREVVVNRIEKELCQLAILFQTKWRQIPYLSVIRDIPFNHHHLQYGEHEHQIPRILLAGHQVHDSNKRVVAHITEC